MICLPNNPRALALINCYGGEDEPLTFDDFPGEIWFDPADLSSLTMVGNEIEVFGNKKDGLNDASPYSAGVRPTRVWDGMRWVARFAQTPMEMQTQVTAWQWAHESEVIVCLANFAEQPAALRIRES